MVFSQAFTLVRALYELWRYVASYFTVKQIINGNTSQLVETQRYYMRAKEASIYDVRTEGGGGLAVYASRCSKGGCVNLVL